MLMYIILFFTNQYLLPLPLTPSTQYFLQVTTNRMFIKIPVQVQVWPKM